MRFIAVFPLLCAVVAFILSMLTLFAGSKPNFIEDAAIITLNTTNLGKTATSALLPDSDDDDDDSGILSDIEDSVTGTIKNVTDGIADQIADAIGIEEFYSLHLMNYCEGTYTPTPTDEDAKKNVTYCSKQKANFDFNLTQILDEQLNTDINIDDLGLTDDINNGLNLLRTAVKGTFIVYCIGIALTGLCILLSLFGIFSESRVAASVNFTLFLISFIFLGVAAGIITSGAVKGTNTINKYGEDVGLAAYRSNKLLGMAWAAAALMLVGALTWLVSCVTGSRKRRTYKHG
ncbi:MAG: hypothetical protein M1825_003591 [Sarcosagium campestre]|nr:MAG: hypothetical protein M1825_003591 [Sarcosagium campestre]